MILSSNIRSLSDFRQNATAHLDRLAATGEVDVLTVNGQAKGVVMAPAVFDEMAKLAEEARITAAIRQGLADIERGDVHDALESMRQIAREKGIQSDR